MLYDRQTLKKILVTKVAEGRTIQEAMSQDFTYSTFITTTYEIFKQKPISEVEKFVDNLPDSFFN